MKFPRLLLLSLVLVAAGQVVLRYDAVPERLASHFDGRGNPNGFLSRPMFFALHLGLVGVMALIFLGLPRLLPRIPHGLINLPRKDYWLAPERSAATLEDMSRKLAWFGCASIAFLIYIEELVIQANLPGAEGRVEPVWLWGGLAAYLVFLVLWLVPLLLHYCRAPKAST